MFGLREALQRGDKPFHGPFPGHAQPGQRPGAEAVPFVEHAEEQVLGADVVVPEQQGFAQGELEYLLGGRAERDLVVGDRRIDRGRRQDREEGLPGRIPRYSQRLGGLDGQAFRFGEQAKRQVLGIDVVVPVYTGLVLRGLDRTPRAVGKPGEGMSAEGFLQQGLPVGVLDDSPQPGSVVPRATVGWRRRNGADVRCRFRPDKQHRARRVIDDEPGGLAQALGSEPGPVAVSRHHQQIRSGRCGHHGPFGMTVNFQFFAVPPEPTRGRLEQVAGRSGGQFLEPGPGIAPAPPEQPQVGAVRGVRHLGRRDVQQGVPGSGRGQAEARIHTGPPRSLGHPYQYRTAGGITAGQR